MHRIESKEYHKRKIIIFYFQETTTVEPLIVDPPNKGHNRNNLSIKDAS